MAMLMNSGKQSAQPDMTPMVDLSFLLLTFFILVSVLTVPKSLQIIYPDEKGDPGETKNAITILLGEKPDQVFYYKGPFKPEATKLEPSNFSSLGIRQPLITANLGVHDRASALRKDLEKGIISQETYDKLWSEIVASGDAVVAVVKTLPKTPYSSVVNCVDELNIASIRKRAIQDMSSEEENALHAAILLR